MNDVILLVSEDSGADRQLRQVLTTSAPACRLELAANLAEIETLPTPSLILLDLMPRTNRPSTSCAGFGPTEVQRGPGVRLAPQTVDVNEAYALGANSCFIQNQEREGLEPIVNGIAAYASLIGEQAGRLPLE